MSDLQISLLVIGAVVVAAVYLFNQLQERKLRRKLEQAFATEHDDVLLAAPPAPASERIEPQLQPPDTADATGVINAGGSGKNMPRPAPGGASDIERKTVPDAIPSVPEFDAEIDCIAQIDANAPIPNTAISELLGKAAVTGKPVRGAGFNAGTGQWEDLTSAGVSRYTALQLALQLVNRSGAIQAAQLAAFCDLVRNCAEKASAAAKLPDIPSTLAAARRLDGFCADVDLAIGVNIIANKGRAFSGTRIRALAEAAGFKLEPEGVFHYRNNQRQTLFMLDNHEPAPFIPEQVKSLSTSGITLLLDVPRVADGQQVFDRMIEIGRGLEQALGGKLVDDNRAALNASGISRIRQQLGTIQANMDEHGIGAGSERALRLFS